MLTRTVKHINRILREILLLSTTYSSITFDEEFSLTLGSFLSNFVVLQTIVPNVIFHFVFLHRFAAQIFLFYLHTVADRNNQKSTSSVVFINNSCLVMDIFLLLFWNSNISLFALLLVEIGKKPLKRFLLP